MTRAHCLKDDNTPLTRSISILACCISLDTRFSNTALVLWLYTAAVELVRFFFHSVAFKTSLNMLLVSAHDRTRVVFFAFLGDL
jgi:hypothetical protein